MITKSNEYTLKQKIKGDYLWSNSISDFFFYYDLTKKHSGILFKNILYYYYIIYFGKEIHMIKFFPKVYPDELVYSVFSRYAVLNGNISTESTSLELFGVRTASYSIFSLNHLDYFVKQLPTDLGISVESIINNNSILPLFKPFMSIERAEKIIGKICNGIPISLFHEVGFNVGNITEYKGHTIKICKHCFKEEIDKYKEAYIHRIHQVLGNLICKEHDVYLSEYTVPSHLNKNILFDINDIDVESIEMNKKIDVEPELLNYFTDLLEDIEFVLNGGLDDYNIDHIKNKYNERLQEKGYLNNILIYQKKLILDFKDYYPEEFLSKLNSSVDENRQDNWINDIFNNYNHLIHPIRHLLLIRFLFGGAKYLDGYTSNYKAFGNGPWPCLNKIAEHYKELTINDYKITACRSNKIVASFECSCGFVYNRQGPDQCENDKHRIGKIVSYGHLWEDKLREHVLEGKLSINQISKEMKTSFMTVIKQANILGILDYLDKKQVVEPKPYSKKIPDEEFNLIKIEILEYIRNNPYASRTQIKKNLSKKYSLAYKRDNEWLESILPEKCNSKDSLKRGYSQEEWKELDEKTLNKIEIAVKEILNDTNNQRITIALIERKIKYNGLYKKNIIEKLPKTKEKLSVVLETIDQYRDRINKNKKIIEP